MKTGTNHEDTTYDRTNFRMLVVEKYMLLKGKIAVLQVWQKNEDCGLIGHSNMKCFYTICGIWRTIQFSPPSTEYINAKDGLGAIFRKIVGDFKIV